MKESELITGLFFLVVLYFCASPLIFPVMRVKQPTNSRGTKLPGKIAAPMPHPKGPHVHVHEIEIGGHFIIEAHGTKNLDERLSYVVRGFNDWRRDNRDRWDTQVVTLHVWARPVPVAPK